MATTLAALAGSGPALASGSAPAGAGASAVPSSTRPATTEPEAPATTVTEVDVVVPAVTPEGEVEVTPELTRARSAEDAVAADEVVGTERVESEVLETDAFQTLGVTWPGTETVDGLAIEARTRADDGTWSDWRPLEASDAGADTGTADAAGEVRGGTDPVWVGEADAVQLSFPAEATPGPDGLRLTLVGSEAEHLPADDAVVGGQADASGVAFSTGPVRMVGPEPAVISRAQWGARAQVCAPDVASTLVAAVVHHTAGSNSYASVAEAMQQIRNDQAYHIDGRGWCDIGYNFIVDKWGNIYEGRANSSTQPVIGVHAGGFNTRTLGISMLGTYGTVTPSAGTQESVARLIAWRLGQYHRDPTSTTGYTTLGGENSSVPGGTTLHLPVVIGHRDVAYTACPGNAGYATLPWLKQRARQLIGPTFINPALTATSIPHAGSVTITGGITSTVDWTLTATDTSTGMSHYYGTGAWGPSGGGAIATWNGRTTHGDPVGPGTYRLTLEGVERASGVRLLPWSATVQVGAGANPPPVAPVALASDLRFVPITPGRLLDTRQTAQALGPKGRVDVPVTGRFGVPPEAKAVALNVTTVASSAVTYLRVWPAGQGEPGASALNTDPARTTGAGMMVGVGGEGKVSILNNQGITHVVVDVTGYYTDAPGKGSPYGQLANGARVLDTRTTGGQLVPGTTRTVQVAGVGGIPADATAVAVNVSTIGPRGPGNVVAQPAGAGVTGTASVNHLPGHDVSNRTIVPLAGGKVDLVLSGAQSDVVLDVVGWFGPSGTLEFTPIVPARAYDTRTDGGVVTQGQTRRFDVTGVSAVPADAQVAVFALAAAGQTARATFVTQWRDGATRPTTSDLNTGAGRDQVNLTFTGLANRRVQVYNNAGSTHLIADVFGYFR
ncbi:N-acetylmuramoyl-L-alanine amidase [Actinotalea ferrariae]|uniref:peptidoglycan recognition protein family protein n=1 Tax=Actinotalea ferrariae TaxID=1386098 RepID=UPI001C8CCCE0|nr:N-acetylmuramoyl-L-alanine amidase [Actinotalea ferrariae]MBX9243914.1 N-acetylmuramoyl-L-alanine amidase [Actinotalea ferrariae]